MSYKVEGQVVPMKAENIMAEAYVAVELGTNAQEVDLPSATSDIPFGVIQSTAAAVGDAVPVMVNGITKVVANGAIAKGVPVYIAATTGRVDDSDTGYPLGLSMEACSNAGEIINILLGNYTSA
jgi:hypothetical protein